MYREVVGSTRRFCWTVIDLRLWKKECASFFIVAFIEWDLFVSVFELYSIHPVRSLSKIEDMCL